MHDTFYVGKNASVLFAFWKVHDSWSIILTALFWFVFAFGYQGLKFFRVYLNKVCLCKSYNDMNGVSGLNK